MSHDQILNELQELKTVYDRLTCLIDNHPDSRHVEAYVEEAEEVYSEIRYLNTLI